MTVVWSLACLTVSRTDPPPQPTNSHTNPRTDSGVAAGPVPQALLVRARGPGGRRRLLPVRFFLCTHTRIFVAFGSLVRAIRRRLSPPPLIARPTDRPYIHPPPFTAGAGTRSTGSGSGISRRTWARGGRTTTRRSLRPPMRRARASSSAGWVLVVGLVFQLLIGIYAEMYATAS